MRRHVRWLIPTVCVPLLFAVSMSVSAGIQAKPDYPTNAGLQLAVFGLIAAAFVGPLVAAIFAIVGGGIVWRRWRRATGHFSAVERRAHDHAAEQHQRADAGWNAARALQTRLVAREVPVAITIWELVPNSGEVMFFDLPADHARYYGQDVSYTKGGGFFFGHPAFVLAGLAASSIGNAARRNAAEAQARGQWREWQPVRVIVTNQRLVCLVAGRWLSFYYSAMTAVYPEVDRWTLICEFGDAAAPLLLAGPNAPIISVMTILLTHGPDAVAAHPSLHRLGGSGLDPVHP